MAARRRRFSSTFSVDVIVDVIEPTSDDMPVTIPAMVLESNPSAMPVVVVGYSLALPHIAAYWFAVLLVLGGALMVNTFLSFVATNEFQISTLGIGPTESRLFFVLANAQWFYSARRGCPLRCP